MHVAAGLLNGKLIIPLSETDTAPGKKVITVKKIFNINKTLTLIHIHQKP